MRWPAAQAESCVLGGGWHLRSGGLLGVLGSGRVLVKRGCSGHGVRNSGCITSRIERRQGVRRSPFCFYEQQR